MTNGGHHTTMNTNSDTTEFEHVVRPLDADSTRSDRDRIARDLVRVGEEGIAVENDAVLDDYFSPEFVFHDPNGGQLDFGGLKALFAAMRAAFTDFSVTRGIVMVEGDYVGSQTRMTGTFEHEFTASPVGTLPPTGAPFTLNLQNLFRYDSDGRLAEEWVQYDQRDMLRQLGAEGR